MLSGGNRDARWDDEAGCAGYVLRVKGVIVVVVVMLTEYLLPCCKIGVVSV